MELPKLEETIKNMTLPKLLMVLDKVMDRISTITEYEEFLESSNLFGYVKQSFKIKSSEKERIEIFERVFTRLSSEKIGYTYELYDEIMGWCKFSYIKEHVLRKNYLAKIIEIFAKVIASNQQKFEPRFFICSRKILT
jgi:hypothetical protein